MKYDIFVLLEVSFAVLHTNATGLKQDLVMVDSLNEKL